MKNKNESYLRLFFLLSFLFCPGTNIVASKWSATFFPIPFWLIVSTPSGIFPCGTCGTINKIGPILPQISRWLCFTLLYFEDRDVLRLLLQLILFPMRGQYCRITQKLAFWDFYFNSFACFLKILWHFHYPLKNDDNFVRPSRKNTLEKVRVFLKL